MSNQEEQNYPSCPYCERPAQMFAAPPLTARRAAYIQHGIVRMPGRLRKRDAPDSLNIEAREDGPRFVAEVSPENFGKQFKDFRLLIVGVDIGFFVFHPDPPPPLTGHVLSLRKRPPAVRPPVESASHLSAYTLFSGFVLEHAGGCARTEAHWWPPHGWIINQRVTLTAPTADPEARNEQLEVARAALDLFVMETRGRPGGFAEVELIKTIQDLGGQATQKNTAKALGTSDRTIREWLAQRGKAWQEFVEEAKRVEIL